MTPYTLQREQWTPRPTKEVFSFFAEAGNLEKITPPWLGFRILSPQPITLHVGAQIGYRIKVHGLPLRWLTEIEKWDPPHEFVDVQVRGPYRLWHHAHRFEPMNGGTLIRDIVSYALPFGPLGRLVHAWLVKRDIGTIFDYRAAKLAELLG